MPQLKVDYSALSEAAWCLQAYKRRHLEHLVPRDEEISTSLLFGEGIHQARATLAQGKGIDSALAAFDTTYTDPFAQNGLLDNVRTPYVGQALVIAYHQKWGPPADTYTEVGAAIELDDFGLYGRIDYVEGSSVVDLKTTSGLHWLPKPRLNWQLVGYAYMVRELTGIEPTEVCVDGVVIPRLPKKIKDSAILPPVNELALTLHENLHRRTAPIMDIDYVNWLRWVRFTVFQIRTCLDTGVFPMRAPVACTRYGRRCDYEPLCLSASEEVAENLSNALYVKKPWSPYEQQ